MKIVMISDTHGFHNETPVPDGDVLIHAGDMTLYGTKSQIVKFNDWLGTLPHEYKVVIPGNHDRLFEENPSVANELITNATLLNDSGTTIKGVYFWGSPVQPWFYNWAFNRQRGYEIKQHWDLIPEETDVLITHGPPRGYGDTTSHGTNNLGCDDLMDAVNRINPRLHVFGHIHGGAGIYASRAGYGHTLFVNAAVLNEQYKPTLQSFVVEL